MFTEKSLVESLPPPEVVRDRLGDALREVELLRGLLKLAEKAAEYRECDSVALTKRVASLSEPSRNGNLGSGLGVC